MQRLERHPPPSLHGASGPPSAVHLLSAPQSNAFWQPPSGVQSAPSPPALAQVPASQIRSKLQSLVLKLQVSPSLSPDSISTQVPAWQVALLRQTLMASQDSPVCGRSMQISLSPVQYWLKPQTLSPHCPSPARPASTHIPVQLVGSSSRSQIWWPAHCASMLHGASLAISPSQAP